MLAAGAGGASSGSCGGATAGLPRSLSCYSAKAAYGFSRSDAGGAGGGGRGGSARGSGGGGSLCAPPLAAAAAARSSDAAPAGSTPPPRKHTQYSDWGAVRERGGQGTYRRGRRLGLSAPGHSCPTCSPLPDRPLSQGTAPRPSAQEPPPCSCTAGLHRPPEPWKRREGRWRQAPARRCFQRCLPHRGLRRRRGPRWRRSSASPGRRLLPRPQVRGPPPCPRGGDTPPSPFAAGTLPSAVRSMSLSALSLALPPTLPSAWPLTLPSAWPLTLPSAGPSMLPFGAALSLVAAGTKGGAVALSPSPASPPAALASEVPSAVPSMFPAGSLARPTAGLVGARGRQLPPSTAETFSIAYSSGPSSQDETRGA